VICASPNEVIVHGIPDDRILEEGDIVSIDCGAIVEGWHGDGAFTMPVGTASAEAMALIAAADDALAAGIAAMVAGNRLGDVGHAIQVVAENAGYSVVRDYCGHGIGMVYHEDPQVLHYGRPGLGLTLEPGMIFTIEPMINAGKHHTRSLPDGWTVVTQDRSLSAQWEHMVAVTPTGFDVLTLAPGEKVA